MPVGLYDGNVYTACYEWIERGEMFNFFLSSNHIEDIISLYDMYGNYQGCVTYNSLLDSSDVYGAIIKEKLFIRNKLWDNAQNIFNKQRDKIIPVFNSDMEMLYIAKYESELVKPWNQLEELQEHVNEKRWKNLQNSQKNFHIVGINDVLFFLRKWLLSLGAKVSVEGEQWGAFGIKEQICKDKDTIIIDKNLEQLNLWHEEYREWLKNDILELEHLIARPCKKIIDEKDRILFYMPAYAYFMDSVSPLISKYLCSGKTCIIIFPFFDGIISIGYDNIRKVIALINRFEAEGGIICNIQTAISLGKYSICYLCSEYSGKVPLELREISDYVVELQTAALYLHMYWLEGRFEEIFSDEEREKIDFLISSSYTADWICKQDPRWEKKFLKFGYPKLDRLYDSLMSEIDIPKEWKKKINEKKVILFTVMEEEWLDVLQEEEWVVIWRPHPLLLKKTQIKFKGFVIRIII